MKWLALALLVLAGCGAGDSRYANYNGPRTMMYVQRNGPSDGLNRCSTLFTNGLLVRAPDYCTLSVGDSVLVPTFLLPEAP